MNLIIKTASGIVWLAIILTILVSAADAVNERYPLDGNADNSADANAEYDSSIIDPAAIKRAADSAERLLDEGVSILPENLGRPVDSILTGIGDLTGEVVRGLLSMNS